MRPLTDDEKAHAALLLLTEREYALALATHVKPERWAEVKLEIAAEEAAEQAREEVLGAAITDRLQYAVRRPGGKGLPPPTED